MARPRGTVNGGRRRMRRYAGRFVRAAEIGRHSLGRPKGAKDKVPRGLMSAVIDQFVRGYAGFGKLLDALDDGVQNPKRALGYLELVAKVKDRVEEKNGAGTTVNVIFKSSLDPSRLRAAATRALPMPSVGAEVSRAG